MSSTNLGDIPLLDFQTARATLGLTVLTIAPEREGPSGCGCGHAHGSAWLGLLFVPWWRRRRTGVSHALPQAR